MLNSQPHLLLVAWGFPPSRSGGAYRLLAIANTFARQGWDVTVLTCEWDVFLKSTGIDVSLVERVDPEVTVVRIPFETAQSDRDLRRWSRFRAYAPELWNGWQANKTQRIFPERWYGSWKPILEEAAVNIHTRHQIDLVIGSANPNVVHTVGWHLNQLFQVPYIMDYRDTWQLDMYSGRRTLRDNSPGARWERRLIGSANEIWFVNDPIADWHAHLYPAASERIHVVPNGFDSDFIAATPPLRPNRAAGLIFGNIGTMTAQTPIAPLIQAWVAAQKSTTELATAQLELYGYLGHLGDDDGRVLDAITDYGNGSVSYRGTVPKSEVAQTYAGLDALILPLGTSRFMTSGKVFEYMATGLPIVSVHHPTNAVSDTLRGYPGWFPSASLEPLDIAKALALAAEFAGNQSFANRVEARKWAGKHERSRILAPIASRLGDTFNSKDVA